jgi:hypothetical protein
MTITLDEGVTDEQGVTPKKGVSDTRSIAAGDNIIDFLLLESGEFFLKEDGSRLKLERFGIDG